MSSLPVPTGGDGRLPPLPLTAVVEATNTRQAKAASPVPRAWRRARCWTRSVGARFRHTRWDGHCWGSVDGRLVCIDCGDNTDPVVPEGAV